MAEDELPSSFLHLSRLKRDIRDISERPFYLFDAEKWKKVKKAYKKPDKYAISG